MSDMSDSEILAAALNGSLESDAVEAVAPVEANEATEAATEVEGAPVASKSGEYTIPYEKLAEARNERNALREEAAVLREQLAALTAQQQSNITQAQPDEHLSVAAQAIEDGVDPAIFGDFSEEALAKGIAALTRQITAQTEAKLRTEFQQMLNPLVADKALAETQSHYAQIYQAHPDADDIVESAQFADWKASLPAFAQPGVDHALTNGSVKDVIDVFTAFKQATNQTTKEAAPDVRQLQVPLSLSSVPGAAPQDVTGQILSMSGNPNGLLDRMQNMTSEQLDALMNQI